MIAVGPDPGRHPDRFGLLASGIAGRPLEVASAQAGELAWTDGSRVHLDPAAPLREQITAVAVQASLLAAGSLAPEVVRPLARRPALARRYLAIEGHRALAANRLALPWSVQSFVDAELAGRAGSAEASLAVARGADPLPDPPRSFGAVHPERLTVASEIPPVVAAALGQRPVDDETARRKPESETEDDSAAPSLSIDLVGGRGALSRLFERMIGFGRTSQGGATGGDRPRVMRVAAARLRGTGPVIGTAALRAAVPAIRHRGITYPEWDLGRRRYRPDWCTVTELDPRDLGTPVLVTGPGLYRPLARLGLSLERRHRRPQGDDLDVDAAVEERVDALTGATPDGAVYIESVRRRHDLAVLVLLDVSGSTAMPSTGGASVHELQRAAAASLTTALDGLGNRVALYGFYSQGRSAVRLVRVKSFDDRLDLPALRRLGALVPGAYTRLGAVIRHGTALLEASGGTTRRILVVLSDGFAYDHGYEGPYAEADARRALAEARTHGTGCLCLSIGAGAELAALRRVFGTAAHATVSRPDDLVPVIGPLLRDAIRAADLRQQTISRRPP
ncbi:nitric oxide reductase activation protein [Nocardia vinacea]|uniref:Nitric oxide reductase activation protein n=1 Tax=Nocardia vinacea TaxID=96468 RepID=A0ABZ1Z0P5_9NOCA|nr:nitric oxide reductase activation protein [Nocardia vinacea]